MAKKIYKPQDAVERSNTENSQWNPYTGYDRGKICISHRKRDCIV
jgi:hypothetical protein